MVCAGGMGDAVTQPRQTGTVLAEVASVTDNPDGGVFVLFHLLDGSNRSVRCKAPETTLKPGAREQMTVVPRLD